MKRREFILSAAAVALPIPVLAKPQCDSPKITIAYTCDSCGMRCTDPTSATIVVAPYTLQTMKLCGYCADGHHSSCGWHTDQYPWECDCGKVRRHLVIGAHDHWQPLWQPDIYREYRKFDEPVLGRYYRIDVFVPYYINFKPEYVDELLAHLLPGGTLVIDEPAFNVMTIYA